MIGGQAKKLVYYGESLTTPSSIHWIQTGKKKKRERKESEHKCGAALTAPTSNICGLEKKEKKNLFSLFWVVEWLSCFLKTASPCRFVKKMISSFFNEEKKLHPWGYTYT